MTAINIGSIQVSDSRWIVFAVEIDSNTLIACTSSDKTEKDANKSLKKALRRLKRYNEIDESKQSPTIKQIGFRLAELHKGKGRPFSLNEISQLNWSAARYQVSKQLLQVPRGKVISYGGLAKRSNSSPRGVGSIMRSNPVPWAIPCHRVIHSDGKLGKLGGTTRGTKEKARILLAEGVVFNNDGTVNIHSIVDSNW